MPVAKSRFDSLPDWEQAVCLACFSAPLPPHVAQENDSQRYQNDCDPNQQRGQVHVQHEQAAQRKRTTTHALHFYTFLPR